MRSIAIIDDRKEFLLRWDRVLSEEGAKVTLFTHPEIFLDFCRKNESATIFDIIIIDRIGPGYDTLTNGFCTSFKAIINDFKGKLVLCSSLLEKSGIGTDGFDIFIPKKILGKRGVLKYIDEVSRNGS